MRSSGPASRVHHFHHQGIDSTYQTGKAVQINRASSIRTSNAIERLHEEFKRRIKTQTVLPSAETAAMLFWALLASGQITMRKVDGWQLPIRSLTSPHNRVTSRWRSALRDGARRRRSEMSFVIFVSIVIGVVVVIVGATVRVHVTMSVGRHHCAATIMMTII